MSIVAAIDCGTNAIRLLVADVRGDELIDIDRRMEIVRLGEGVDATGRLSEAALGRTFAACERYAVLLDELGAERVRFVATDLRGNTADAAAAVRLAVKPLGHVAALEQYRPAVVLAAWMNKDEDWTAAIAATASVHEYVLIGERDYGVSGTSDGTWGLARPGSPVALAVPRWRAEGFVRMDLERLSLLQVCRTDSPAVRFHCKTVVFRRGRLAADAPPPDRAKAEL